jgi:outer membrane protein assembly factor BamB
VRDLPATTRPRSGALLALAASVLVLATGTSARLIGASVPFVPASLPLTLTSTAPIQPMARIRPAVTDRAVVLATVDGRLEAHPLDDPGTVIWTKPFASVTAMAAGDGFVFATTSTSVAAIDAETGQTRWSKELDARGAPLLWLPGWLFVPTSNGVLTALRTADGTERWHAGFGAPLAAPPSSDGQIIVGALLDRRVVALNVATGATRWVSTLEPALSTVMFAIFSPHFAPPMGFVSVRDMIAPLPAAPGPPLVANDRVYVSGDDGALYFLDAQTGNIDRHTDLIGGRSSGPPAADARHVFVATVDGLLTAYGSEKGALAWKQAVTAPANDGPLVDGGLVFIAFDSGDLRGLMTDTGVTAATLAAPPTTERHTQLAVPAVLAGSGESLRIVTITDTGVSWAITVYSKARLTTTPLMTLPGRPLQVPWCGCPAPH